MKRDRIHGYYAGMMAERAGCWRLFAETRVVLEEAHRHLSEMAEQDADYDRYVAAREAPVRPN